MEKEDVHNKCVRVGFALCLFPYVSDRNQSLSFISFHSLDTCSHYWCVIALCRTKSRRKRSNIWISDVLLIEIQRKQVRTKFIRLSLSQFQHKHVPNPIYLKGYCIICLTECVCMYIYNYLCSSFDRHFLLCLIAIESRIGKKWSSQVRFFCWELMLWPTINTFVCEMWFLEHPSTKCFRLETNHYTEILTILTRLMSAFEDEMVTKLSMITDSVKQELLLFPTSNINHILTSIHLSVRFRSSIAPERHIIILSQNTHLSILDFLFLLFLIY